MSGSSGMTNVASLSSGDTLIWQHKRRVFQPPGQVEHVLLLLVRRLQFIVQRLLEDDVAGEHASSPPQAASISTSWSSAASNTVLPTSASTSMVWPSRLSTKARGTVASANWRLALCCIVKRCAGACVRPRAASVRSALAATRMTLWCGLTRCSALVGGRVAAIRWLTEPAA